MLTDSMLAYSFQGKNFSETRQFLLLITFVVRVFVHDDEILISKKTHHYFLICPYVCVCVLISEETAARRSTRFCANISVCLKLCTLNLVFGFFLEFLIYIFMLLLPFFCISQQFFYVSKKNPV